MLYLRYIFSIITVSYHILWSVKVCSLPDENVSYSQVALGDSPQECGVTPLNAQQNKPKLQSCTLNTERFHAVYIEDMQQDSEPLITVKLWQDVTARVGVFLMDHVHAYNIQNCQSVTACGRWWVSHSYPWFPNVFIELHLYGWAKLCKF